MTQVRLLSVGAISVFLIYAFTFAMMHSPIMEEDPTSPENATTPMEADVPHSPENAITTMGTAAPHSPESPILCEMNGTDVMITVAHHRLGAFGRNIMYHSPMPGGSQLVILTPTPIAQLPAPFTRSCVITEAGFFEPAGLSARIQALVQSWKSVERAVFITPDHLITGNLANLFQIPTQGLPEHSLISKDPNPHAMVITRTGSPFGLKAPPIPTDGRQYEATWRGALFRIEDQMGDFASRLLRLYTDPIAPNCAAIVLLCSGNYEIILEGFLKSFHRYWQATPAFRIYVWMDRTRMPTHDELYFPIPTLGWPNATMLRPHYFLEKEALLAHHRYIYSIDVDLYAEGNITDAILGSLVGAMHGFLGPLSREKWTFETNPASKAYLDYRVAETYFQGNLYGGEPYRVIPMWKEISRNIEADAKIGIVAKWHEESHLNRYLSDHRPVKILPHTYLNCCDFPAYPEPKFRHINKNHVSRV